MKRMSSTLLVLLLAGSVFSQVRPNAVFRHLRLDMPGLAGVRAALLQGDSTQAQRALLLYFRTRKNRHMLFQKFPLDLAEAGAAARNVITIKGFTHDFGRTIDWRFQGNDIEWNRSLNRFNWLEQFCGAYARTGDERYVRAWMDQVRSWIEACPPGFPRTIDTGRRLHNWVLSFEYFVHSRRSPSVSPRFLARMLEAMRRDAEFLYRPEHWRRFSNWGTFENQGLAFMAVLFPEFRRNSLWLKEVWFRMYFQLQEDFYPDGMHKETSPSYHSHELQVWFDFLRQARANGLENPWHGQVPLPPEEELFLPRVRALMYLYKPDGTVPQVGDTDRFSERAFLREVGETFHAPDLVWVATDGRRGAKPEHTSVCFPQGGYTVLRSGWGEGRRPFGQELYLLFDCGSTFPWHAHYDMLSVTAMAYGHDLLCDPGRYTYTRGPERDYFKGTAAHNTIVMDGRNQPKYTPAAPFWVSTPAFDYVAGKNDSRPEAVHRRSIFFVKPEYWIVVDRLTGKLVTHFFDQYWHLSREALSKVRIRRADGQVWTPHFALLERSSVPDSVFLETGFLSPHYRRKIPAPVIRYRFRGEKRIVRVTVLYPFARKPDGKLNLAGGLPGGSPADPAGDVIVLFRRGGSATLFFERSRGASSVAGGRLFSDARAGLVKLDSRGRIAGFALVSGRTLRYGEKELFSAAGKPVSAWFAGDSLSVVGSCVVRFSSGLKAVQRARLNGRRISLRRGPGGVTFGPSEVEE